MPRPTYSTMRDDYLQKALKTIDDPYILVNVVSRRVKQLRRGARALVESLEKLAPEDIALREIIEGKISYELGSAEVPEPWRPPVRTRVA
jgi:DNA-directed RNA polymerase subunit omega